jgi:hypothetical protein
MLVFVLLFSGPFILLGVILAFLWFWYAMLQYIDKLGVDVGSKVEIERAGEVIPRVIRVVNV